MKKLRDKKYIFIALSQKLNDCLYERKRETKKANEI